VEKEDHLPKVKMPNGKLYACQELNELKFIRFVSSTLSDAGLKLPETAVHEIVNRLDPKDLYYTHSEIQKFVALVKYRETVTSQDIRTVGGDKKKTIFDLIDAFLLRRDDLGKILMGLEQQGEIPLVILTMLFDTVEKAILLKSMKSKGGGLESFIEATKTHPFQAKKLDGAILNLSADTLVAWHDRLCSIDIALKYSGQNEYTTLRAFFLEQELPNHV
jgi:DNA polymerase III delta subunit